MNFCDEVPEELRYVFAVDQDPKENTEGDPDAALREEMARLHEEDVR